MAVLHFLRVNSTLLIYSFFRYKEFTEDLNKLMRSLLSDNVAQELGDLYAGAFDRFVFDYRLRRF